MENETNSFYPPKPFLEKEKEQQGHLAVTVFSLVLFALSFILFFDEQIVFLVELIAVLFVHEMGHYLMMKHYKYEHVRMLFIPFMGAFVHGKKEKYSQKQSALVVLAGPIPGIILATAMWLLGIQFEQAWMIDVSLMAYFLNVVNLFPLQPLDGGKLLSILFFEKLELFQIVFTFISSLALIGIGYFTDVYLLIIIGFAMGIQVRSMHRKYLIHKTIQEKEAIYIVTYEELTDKDYHIIKREVMEQTPGIQKFVELSMDENSDLIVASEVKNVLVNPMSLDLTTAHKIVVFVLWSAAIFAPAYFVYLHYSAL